MAFDKPTQSLIRKIKQTAPSYSIDGYRRGYYGGGDEETSSSFESVLIYIQKGLGGYDELIKQVVRLIFKVQKDGTRKYPLIPMSFGDEPKLTHEGKYYDLGYLNDAYNDIKITKTLVRLSGTEKTDNAIIPELFPKTDTRSLYTGKTRVTENDLLVIIGKKDQVFFEQSLEPKLIIKIKKHILFVEIEEDNINWIYKNYLPEFKNSATSEITKKITRGICKNFAEAFTKSDLFKFYLKNKQELIIGIRNNYLNLYYNCDSIAKIKYIKDNIVCEIDKYYIDGNHYNSKDEEKRFEIQQYQIIKQYPEIKKNSDDKTSPEKKAQSKLIILNNQNDNSNWYCVDLEYVKAFMSQGEKKEADFNGRFDIIAISKVKPHKIALIELKYGSGAIGGTSGIYKHVKDFKKFIDKGYFEKHLKHEIIEILKSHKYLGINIPFELPILSDILEPDFYFITLDNNAEKASSPKQTMAGYLFKDYRWDCNRLSTKYCVEKDFGDITKKRNDFHATFLFSKENLDNLKINDIIDGNYDETISPE